MQQSRNPMGFALHDMLGLPRPQMPNPAGALPQDRMDVIGGPQTQRHGFLAPGSKGAMIAGIIGDALAGATGGQPLYTQSLMRDREQQREETQWTRRQASQLQNEMALKQYEASLKSPEQTALEKDTNAYIAMDAPHRAAYDAMHPIYRTGPDGLPYATQRPGLAPTRPIGGLTPVAGGPTSPTSGRFRR
jgi:hypothetical protein